MRIVGGEFRGRVLDAPNSDAIRPTTDRVRESLFNILTHSYPENLAGARVLDLFAGTGALGMEALSRGAEFALFLEQSVEGRGLLRSNIETLGLQGKTKVFRRDASALGARGNIDAFNLVFADPPYGKGLGELAMKSGWEHGWFAPDALFILEEKSDHHPEQIDGFERVEVRRFGKTAMSFWTIDK